MIRHRKNKHVDEANEGIVGYLLASGQARFWIAVAFASLFAILAVGVVMSTDSAKVLDNINLSSSASNVSALENDNQVNTAQLPDSSFIYDVSIEELASADTYLNDQTVQVTGEVVGDRIFATDNNAFSWITLQSMDATDDELGVYMPNTFVDLIDSYGKYGQRGTVLQVRGTFNLACDDHEGASELHADHVSVVMKGASMPIPFNAGMLLPGLLLILIGSISMLVYIGLQERQR